MASQPPVEAALAKRRCLQCGTQVARQATACFMCGQPLRPKPLRFRWRRPDPSAALIVLLAGLLLWQFTQQRNAGASAPAAPVAVLPPPLDTPVPTPAPTPTPRPPTPVPPTPIVPTPQPVQHIVASGNTLIGIATLHQVALEDLKRANNLDSNVIHSGQTLLIPGKVHAPPPAPVVQRAPTTTDFNYAVQAGDTIISIAYRFGATPEELFFANDLNRDAILHKGDHLVVPVPLLSQEVVASSDLAPRTANTVYPGPRLLGPTDGALISRRDSVLFRWLSVDLLAPNEWYVLRIWSPTAEDANPPPIWTKATSYRLENAYAAREVGSQQFLWHVTVVRVVAPSIQSAPRELQSASLSSGIRHFTWQ